MQSASKPINSTSALIKFARTRVFMMYPHTIIPLNLMRTIIPPRRASNHQMPPTRIAAAQTPSSDSLPPRFPFQLCLIFPCDVCDGDSCLSATYVTINRRDFSALARRHRSNHEPSTLKMQPNTTVVSNTRCFLPCSSTPTCFYLLSAFVLSSAQPHCFNAAESRELLYSQSVRLNSR